MGRGMVVLSIIGIIIAIVAIAWYVGRMNMHDYNQQMADANCFPLGVNWIEEKQDYDTWPPTGWDCSRTLGGEPKYGTD